MLQRYDVCKEQLSANLLFMADDAQPISLFANSFILQSMTKHDKITEEDLLKRPNFSEILYKNSIIISFSY